MNTPRILLAALAVVLVGCQSAQGPHGELSGYQTTKPAHLPYVFYVGTSGAKAQGVLRCTLDGLSLIHISEPTRPY